MNPNQVLLVLHIAFTAVWFGSSVSNAGRVRRALASGEAEAKFGIVEIGRSLKLSHLFGFLTILSGLALVFSVGGFEHVRKGIHAGFGITILMLLIELTVVRGSWKKISQVIELGQDRTLAAGPKKLIAIFGGIEQLLWLAVLVLMVEKTF